MGMAEAAALAEFRRDWHACLERRADALFELTDAVLCADGPVVSLPELSLTAEHRRGHGALYDGLACGRIAVNRLRRSLSGLALPRDEQGRITLAVDVSPWLRPDALTSSERLFCHTYGRGKGSAQMIPGWPYSLVAALNTPHQLDGDPRRAAARSRRRHHRGHRRPAARPRDTAAPGRATPRHRPRHPRRARRRIRHHPPGPSARRPAGRTARPGPLGPGVLLPAPPRPPGSTGRPSRHGDTFDLDRADDQPAVATTSDTSRYGAARAHAWHRLHPRLTRRAAWKHHHGELPIIDGTIIRLTVDRLPGDRHPKPLWLWHSRPNATAPDVDRLWRAFLRRFDIEHTFRFLKQTLGWTRPRLRTPGQADRWTWLIIAAHTQLRLTRTLAEDHRRPWEKPATQPRRLTPPASDAGFATSARQPATRPAHRNRHTPAQDAHPASRTNSAHPTTTSASTPQPQPTMPKRVKNQAKTLATATVGSCTTPTSAKPAARACVSPRPSPARG